MNRNVTTFRQDAPKMRVTNELTAQSVPTPVPRGKLNKDQQISHISPDTNQFRHHVDDLSNQHLARLVNVDQHSPDSDDSTLIKATRKRTSFNDVPVEFVSDEGVESPTNIDYDDDDHDHDDEEAPDECYEDEEDFEVAEQADELTNLSRQSMMPLHELIAYYQYIQQGNQGFEAVQKASLSRQTSSASQQTTRTKHSFNEPADAFDGESSSLTKGEAIHPAAPDELAANSSEEKADLEPTVTGEEMPFTKIEVPKLQVENADMNDGDGDEKAIRDVIVSGSQKQVVAPLKDKRRIRANVVLELINSERDFVKHLRDVVEGYLYPARRHPEIFTGERISTIFSNIEQLYEFQRKFLESLETCIDWEDLAQSEVGNCFIAHKAGFSVYHYYCNNHPNATSELQDLYTKPRFVKFFEACRLLQNMIDISLDGFLLTPIQKICKYPLQLNELFKNTDEDHPDYQAVANALESMRNCANLANERKRRIEALADVMSFQEKVENWFGPKLSDTSSILIHSGEVSKMASHTWSQGVQLYLFDHLLLYSKKDLLKRNSIILKGRICMDTVTEISDADEYKPRKSFKIYCGEQQKWFVFTTRSEKEKDEWIRAFERERNLIESDESEGFHITDREIGIARRALQNRKHSRSARYRHKRPDTAIVDQLDLDDANMIMNRTLSLPSCIHPSHVMNFVEDSKVVSGSSRKKNCSPNSSTRSPNASCQYIGADQSEIAGGQPTGGGSWFRKMGSKKLAKSQVYNVNGPASGSAKQSQTTSPIGAEPVVTLAASTAITSTSAATNYDQLEKRHRDHMVSEEQARLFRLNNDLPQPIFAGNPKLSKTQQPSQGSKAALRNEGGFRGANQMSGLANFKSLNLGQPDHCETDPGGQRSACTFETTVVLSSGRVVTIREDTV